MVVFLHKMISSMFITNEDMFLGFKIRAIEERKPFDLMIFVFWQLEDGTLHLLPMTFRMLSCDFQVLIRIELDENRDIDIPHVRLLCLL